MAGKLYRQQGRTLSVQPVNAEIKQPSLEPITDTIVKSAAKIAQENYALGNSIALHDSLEYAYNQAKDSPEQFSKLADSTIKTFADRLPSNVRNNLMDKFITAKQKYASKVETNYYNKLDAEHTDSIHKNSELSTNDMLTQADSLYNSIVNRDDKNAAIALANYKNSQNNLRILSEAKNIKGDYIYNTTERKSAQNTQTGHVDAFKKNVDTLSLDELKKFDSEIFQDKLLFQQKTGVDEKTYDEMSKYIKGRRTDLGDEEKRVIQNQASYSSARFLSTRDPEEYKELKKSGVLPKEVFSAIDKVYKTAPSQAKTENAFVLEKTIQHLYDEIGVFDPRFDDAKNIQEAVVRFGNSFEKFSNDNGLDQTQQQEVLDMATKYISDKLFRESAKGLFEDTAISARIKGKDFDNPKSPNYQVYTKTSQKFGDKTKAERYAQEVAHDYTRAWALSAMAGDYDKANKILQEGNRAVIIAANSDKIPEGEFYRMERDLSNGKPAYYTMLDGRTVQFMGYSNKDAIFKIKM